MTALLRFNFRRKGFVGLLESLATKERYLREPLTVIDLVERIEAVMRMGIEHQFAVGGNPAWAPSKPFGNRQPRRPTLGGVSGRVARAWADSPIEKGPREIRIRVRDVVALAQHRGATIRPKQHPSHMRLALLYMFGVRLSEERLQIGLVLPPRPVRYTDKMVLGTKLAISSGFSAT